MQTIRAAEADDRLAAWRASGGASGTSDSGVGIARGDEEFAASMGTGRPPMCIDETHQASMGTFRPPMCIDGDEGYAAGVRTANSPYYCIDQ